MSSLTQNKKTCQARYKFSEFNPGTCTSTWVEREINITYGSLRKPEIGENEQRHIRKIKREARKLDPETLQTLIQTYINNVLNSPVDDHPPPGLNAPKHWTEKGIEQKEDTQSQEAEPGRMSKDEAEARKNRAREEHHRVMSQRPVKTRTEPTEPPPKQEKARPKAKAKVIKFPKYPTPPEEIWDFCKAHYLRGEKKKIVRGLHKWHLYRERREDKNYHGKSKRKNRQYVWGQQWLADKLKLHINTIQKAFDKFEADGIIYVCQRGYKDRGASIIELAYTEAHRRINKRKTGERKNPPSIRYTR